MNKNSFISGLANNDILIFYGEQKTLKDAYDLIYSTFSKIGGCRKYVKISSTNHATAGHLLELYGGKIFGTKPSIEQFSRIAAALANNLTIISTGKAYSEYLKIIKKCNLDTNLVVSVNNI